MTVFHNPSRNFGSPRVAALTRPNARTATIRTLVQKGMAEAGVAPTAGELASKLAMAPARVREHLRLLGLGER